MIQRDYRPQLEEAGRKPTKEEVVAAFTRLNVDMERRLNEPPARNLFQKALFDLQERGRQPSRSPRRCNNEKCTHPYFFASKTSRKYCSKKCVLEGKRKIKLDSWNRHKDEWRPR